MPKIRTIFGTAQRPRRTRKHSSLIEAAIETPTYDLTVFKLHFGRLTGKAYNKGERVLRFEAIAHNTAELRCGRMIEKFPEIVPRLAGVVERFELRADLGEVGDDAAVSRAGGGDDGEHLRVLGQGHAGGRPSEMSAFALLDRDHLDVHHPSRRDDRGVGVDGAQDRPGGIVSALPAYIASGGDQRGEVPDRAAGDEAAAG